MYYQNKISYLLLGIIFILMIHDLSAGTDLILHSGDSLFVHYGTTPYINGIMSSGEWDDAISVVLVEPGGSPGDVVVYLKHDSSNLYAAFVNSNDNYWIWWILLDTQNNGGSAPQSDDYKLIGPGFDVENVGNGSEWVETTPSGWASLGTEEISECYFSYSKLGITPGVAKTIGIAIGYGGGMPWENVWPAGFDTWNEEVIPGTWGDIASTDSWGQATAVKEGYPEKKTNMDLCSYPNPFSEMLFIDFTLLNHDHTVLQIYDIEGRLIRILTNQILDAGCHQFCWDRRDYNGNIVPAGTYFCRLRTEKTMKTWSVVVINR